MTTSLSLLIPSTNGDFPIELQPGSITTFVGANGSGKTRLGAYIEEKLPKAHRIAAQKSLVLEPQVQSIDVESATSKLLTGNAGDNPASRRSHRWGNKPATHPLNDIRNLMEALYADQNQVAVKFKNDSQANKKPSTPLCKFDRLKSLWEELLPNRKITLHANDFRITSDSETYSPADLSDGERVIFYLLGQSLMVKTDGVLIIDEPEAHINKAILSNLFNIIERERSDCAIIYITHDLEFAASRFGANKYSISAFQMNPLGWSIEILPENTGFPEKIVSTIMGSKKPILFVEGKLDSLDATLYEAVYDCWTIVPCENRDAVIHSVGAFNAHQTLHHHKCAGIIDRDYLKQNDILRLKNLDVYAIQVAQVENFLLLPSVFELLAKQLCHENPVPTLKKIAYNDVKERLSEASAAYAKFQLDRELKAISISSKTAQEMQEELMNCISNLDIYNHANDYRDSINKAIDNDSLEEVLALYKNKGLLANAATTMFGWKKKQLEELIARMIRSKDFILINTLRKEMPEIPLQSAKDNLPNKIAPEKDADVEAWAYSTK